MKFKVYMVSFIKYACIGAFLILWLTPADAVATEHALVDAHSLDSAVARAISLTGFPIDERSVQRAQENAQSVTLHFQSRGQSLDTMIYKAWRFTFLAVPLKWHDGQTYVRDYDVLVERNSGGLLLVRSPATSDTAYVDRREGSGSRHPQFDGKSAMSSDSTVISFSEALLGCNYFNPLKAKSVEATLITYCSMVTDSVLVWDIVGRGDVEFLSGLARRSPRLTDEQAEKIVRERTKTAVRAYVREFINAQTGRSMGGAAE